MKPHQPNAARTLTPGCQKPDRAKNNDVKPRDRNLKLPWGGIRVFSFSPPEAPGTSGEPFTAPGNRLRRDCLPSNERLKRLAPGECNDPALWYNRGRPSRAPLRRAAADEVIHAENRLPPG